MDFEQFFPEVKVSDCDCSNHVQATMVIITGLCLLVDCITSCKRNRKISKLTSENETLKSMILASVEKVILKMMKNGNQSEDDDSE
jgi:ABC-type transporter Mla MlaB component